MFHRQHLVELKAHGYRPSAWPRYVWGHLRLARRVIESRPGVVRSILATGFCVLALLFIAAGALAVSVDAPLGRRFFLSSSLWLAIHCVWLLLHIGLAIDRHGRPLQRLGVPNTITLVRSAMTPGLVVLLEAGHIELGCVVYAVGALLDVADGAAARRLGQVTRLGTVTDPLVDVAWNTAAVAGLIAAGLLPAWMLLLVGVRYGLLLLGSLVLYLTRTTVRIRPTLFGKASGAAISLATVLIFFNRLVLPELWRERLSGLMILALGFLVSSTIAYVLVLGLLNFRRTAPEPPVGRIVGDVRGQTSQGVEHDRTG